MVKDLRTGVETSNTGAVDNVDRFLGAALAAPHHRCKRHHR
jgi:hypothetical protein